jgi:hypothetical protein
MIDAVTGGEIEGNRSCDLMPQTIGASHPMLVIRRRFMSKAERLNTIYSYSPLPCIPVVLVSERHPVANGGNGDRRREPSRAAKRAVATPNCVLTFSYQRYVGRCYLPSLLFPPAFQFNLVVTEIASLYLHTHHNRRALPLSHAIAALLVLCAPFSSSSGRLRLVNGVFVFVGISVLGFDFSRSHF